MKNKRVKERIEAIYAKVPEVHCQGKCWEYCSLLAMSGIEMKRLVDAGGAAGALVNRDDMLCGSLDRRSHRCRAYAVRPLICRLFGAVKRLRCPHGCVPDRWVSDEEAWALFSQVCMLSRELGYDEQGRGTRLDASSFQSWESVAHYVNLDMAMGDVRGRDKGKER